jgi:S-methylmethionine-dependent homocysteine/selenocysteine methylase
MDPHVLQKLEKLDALVPLRAGTKGVRVSLQYKPSLTELSRSSRRNALRAKFEQVAHSIEPQGAEVDLDSISVSAQTIEALLPIDYYEELISNLNKQDIRVDLLIDRQIV